MLVRNDVNAAEAIYNAWNDGFDFCSGYFIPETDDEMDEIVYLKENTSFYDYAIFMILANYFPEGAFEAYCMAKENETNKILINIERSDNLKDLMRCIMGNGLATSIEIINLKEALENVEWDRVTILYAVAKTVHAIRRPCLDRIKAIQKGSKGEK